MHRLGRVDFETTPFPHQQQSEGVVEFGVGEQHSLKPDHSAFVGVQIRESLDLGLDVRRGVEQKPLFPISTHRDRRL